MKTRAAWGWAVVLLGGIAAPFTAPAWAADPNPVTLNMPAPELTGGEWRNTRGKHALTLGSERGKVTILHFWTFG